MLLRPSLHLRSPPLLLARRKGDGKETEMLRRLLLRFYPPPFSGVEPPSLGVENCLPPSVHSLADRPPPSPTVSAGEGEFHPPPLFRLLAGNRSMPGSAAENRETPPPLSPVGGEEGGLVGRKEQPSPQRRMNPAADAAGGVMLGEERGDGSTPSPPAVRRARGSVPPLALSQSRGVSSGGNNDKMEAARMFDPEPFPLKGGNFERTVKALAGHARSTYNVLHHFHLLTLPKRWEDELQPAQQSLLHTVFKPEDWFESGAIGEFVAAIQAVPVLAVHLVRRLNILKFFAISTYNGRVAIFSIRALEKVCPWRERVDLLPPEVRAWLLDPDVVVITSGERRTFLRKLQGIEVVNQIDTERIFQIYQDRGVIRPAVTAERGDLTWQLAFALGYHASPSRRSTWRQLIGDDKFQVQGRDWPEWRMPGWQPDSVWELKAKERFNLYFNTYGPHIFVSRLLRHGLVYGGMEAVVGDVPLRDCYLLFLQGAMEEPELKKSNPLGLHSDLELTERRDRSSPAVRLYNEKYVHLRTPLEKEEAKCARMAAVTSAAELSAYERSLFPEQPSSTTAALRGSPATSGGESELEEGELQEETVEIVEEEEEEPLEICVGEEDLSLCDDNNNENARTPDSSNPAVGLGKGARKKDNRLPRKGRGGGGKEGGQVPPQDAPANSGGRSEAEIQEALRHLAHLPAAPAPKKADPAKKETERKVTLLKEQVPLPQTSKFPMAHRLGPSAEVQPIPSTSANPPPHPGYYTAAGWEEQKRKEEEEKGKPEVVLLNSPSMYKDDPPLLLGDLKRGDQVQPQALEASQQDHLHGRGDGGPDKVDRRSTRFAPFDHRSRLQPKQADAGLYRDEAQHFPPAPVAVVAPDRNLVLAARTRRGPKPQGPVGARKRDRKRSRRLSKMLLDHPELTLEQVVNNPYVAAPYFDKRCSFCASWHCSRYLKNSRTPNCVCFKEQMELAPSRRLCDYRRCMEATDHHTAVCPTLHARCTTCQCRGHTSSHGCDLRDERVMERLRYDFEETADLGVYTQKRFSNLAWGFYPYPQSAPRNVVVVSYRRLSDLPVLAALGLLHSILQLPENRPLPQGGVLESGHRLSVVGDRGGAGVDEANPTARDDTESDSDD